MTLAIVDDTSDNILRFSGTGATFDVAGALTSTNLTIADGIYHEGDTNTSITFGTDTININTGGGVRAAISNSGVKFNNNAIIAGGATLSLGEAGEEDDNGRTVLIEGAANGGNGEGSGRIFFSENNNTATNLYGLSLYYEGDPNAQLPSGFQPNTGNATWSLRTHNNNINGAAVMSGSRTNVNVLFGGTVTVGAALNIPEYIYHNGDTDTYIKFDTNRVRIVAGNITKFDSDTIYTGTVQTVTGTGTVSGLSLSDDGDSVDPTLTLSGTISISSANITDVAANADATPSWVPATNPNYLTSYTETDTFSSVTGRGASTTTSLSIRNLTSRTILPEADRTYDLGAEETRWAVVYCETLDSAGQHESKLQNPEGEKSIGDYATGTVLVWKGGKNIPCTEAADHMRMGIAVNGIDSPLVQGAEPVLVTGSVNEGDYLVTSSVEGHAKAITPQFMRQHMLFDCVIGKALESGKGDSHLIKTWINI